MNRNNLPVLIEAGHYYTAKGPTQWSEIGARIAQERKLVSDKTMLFIDDMHDLSQVREQERLEPVVSIDHYLFDYTIYESEMIHPAKKLVEYLLQLPKSKRAKQNEDGRCFCSGFPITKTGGEPLCVLLDVALTKRKYEMGFQKIVNILPYYYEEEQQHTAQILRKVINDENFEFTTLFFEKNGAIREVSHLKKRVSIAFAQKG